MPLEATNILSKESTEIYHTSARMQDLLCLMIQGAIWHAWIIKATPKGSSHCSSGHNILSAVSTWNSLRPLTKVILSSKDIYVPGLFSKESFLLLKISQPNSKQQANCFRRRIQQEVQLRPFFYRTLHGMRPALINRRINCKQTSELIKRAPWRVLENFVQFMHYCQLFFNTWFVEEVLIASWHQY